MSLCIQARPKAPLCPPFLIEANSGGPASRRRTERLRASVLRTRRGADEPVSMPPVLRAGLRFPVFQDPVSRTLESLARFGLDDAERLRERFPWPDEPLLVRVVPAARWATVVIGAHDEAILRNALLLGLCTAWQYDPARPVIWTRTSLDRCVELYAPGRFYA